MAIDLPVAMIGATVQIEQPQPDRGNVRVVGTGVLVSAPRPDGSPRTVLVTAGHVFDAMPGEVASVGFRLQGPDGHWRYAPQRLSIRNGPVLQWVRNPDEDVAVIAIQAPPEIARAAIPVSWLADDSSFQGGGIEPGDEMFVLGFPQGLAANPEGFPILRAAHVASYPLITTPSYPRFMLDVQVFEGMSGGPVFLASPIQRRPGDPISGVPYVVGLIAAAATKYEWAFAIEAPVVRRTIAILDSPAAPAASPTPAPFVMLPAMPTKASAAADAPR